MSDLTDNNETMQEHEPRIPKTMIGKTRMIYKLRTQRFYWSLAFFYSLFLNLIFIWGDK